MEIPTSRLKHSLAVAEKMRSAVIRNPEKFSCTPEEAFTIGLLHDIGYRFTDIPAEHNKRGGEILKQTGYKFWREVYYHGEVQSEYTSNELTLLNYTDLTTGPDGNILSMDERLEDIERRDGRDSVQAVSTRELINQLKKLNR